MQEMQMQQLSADELEELYERMKFENQRKRGKADRSRSRKAMNRETYYKLKRS